MVLVDTSVWVAALSRRPAFRLENVVDFDDVVTCSPIVQEVLQGIREESAFRRARSAMTSLPIVESPAPIDLFLEAAALYRQVRAAGWTVRSSVDCLIAACAIRHDLELLHRDRDFPAIARVAALRHRAV